MVANDCDSYQYLVESICKFCSQDKLITRMEAAEFEGVRYTNMTGGMSQCMRDGSLCDILHEDAGALS